MHGGWRLRCSRHPDKRTIASCKDCGAGFCIECVRETDQTNVCPECYRRGLNELAREYAPPAGEKGQREAPGPPEGPAAPAAEALPSTGGEAAAPSPRAEGARAGFLGRRREWGRRKVAAGEAATPPGGDFLAQGPDEDFSQLVAEKRKAGRRSRREKAAAVPGGEGAEVSRGGEEAAKPEAPARSEEALLRDVVSALLVPEAGAAGAEAPGIVAGEAGEEAAARARVRREERAERWSFLAQPRSAQYTVLAAARWRSALFVALMLLAGAVLWAAPNAYLVPKDQEYGVHAVAIGLIIGLAFWWKAGKRHGTKLAAQAALTTFFALFIGEFLHWFLSIVKNSAFRTIFFDLVSFQFLWENGARIMRDTMEAMFPLAFVWILVLPTAVAFIIGFGLPPIPEIFFQIWRALRGGVPVEEEAGHGMEG